MTDANYHGHMTHKDGSHTALSKEEAATLFSSFEKHDAEMAVQMPHAWGALGAIGRATERLRKLGWRKGGELVVKKGDECAVIEIGGVIDDGISPIKDLKSFNFIIKHETFHCEAYAAGMHERIFLSMREEEAIMPVEAIEKLLGIIEECGEKLRDFRANNGLKPKNRIQMAGKNLASFDIPKIKKFIFIIIIYY